MKRVSDEKSLELFGMSNEEHYDQLSSKKWIDFPREEFSSLQARLEAGKPIFTTRTMDEMGKYRVGIEVIAPWDQVLRVVEVRPINDVEDHPFLDELTASQIEQLSNGSMELIKLEKV